MSAALTERHCQRETRLLSDDAVSSLKNAIHADWSISDDSKSIERTFRFKNYYQTIAFVNALAWVAHAQQRKKKEE